ncbi:hypothetical protein N234_08315 [Ralstonia pickettii DTP0602]|nr:hypothetical protein N234_08315 [Ralstonia pickettii DTP0602]
MLKLDNAATDFPVVAVISASGGFQRGDDVAVDAAIAGTARNSANEICVESRFFLLRGAPTDSMPLLRGFMAGILFAMQVAASR